MRRFSDVLAHPGRIDKAVIAARAKMDFAGIVVRIGFLMGASVFWVWFG
jgi:hypothetical protein